GRGRRSATGGRSTPGGRSVSGVTRGIRAPSTCSGEEISRNRVMIHDFGRFLAVRSRSSGSLRTGRQSVGGTTRADRGVLPIDRGDEGAAPLPPLQPRAGAPHISSRRGRRGRRPLRG